MDIKIKRAFENQSGSDEYRILVDRLWPIGISKEKAKIDFWPKELSHSNKLQKWYNHDPQKWLEFKIRYFAKIEGKTDLICKLQDYLEKGSVTFIYSSKEQNLNNVVALKEYFGSLYR